MGSVSSISEIIYSSALAQFGILGGLFFTLVFLFPIVLYASSIRIRRSVMRTAAFKGLMIYMIVACADGALNLIPTMAFYWFTYMVMLEGWPGGLEIAREVPYPPSYGVSAISHSPGAEVSGLTICQTNEAQS